MIQQAIILAAGNGSRIKRFKGDVPKPLRKMAGLTLIKRSLITLQQVGIEEVVVVVGYKGDQIIQALQSDRQLRMKLSFVVNEDYKKSNGLSLLTAQSHVREKFLLLMADHVFDPVAIQKMVKISVKNDEVIVGIDQRLESVFDLDDATKVRLEGGKVADIGKSISAYDACDTGVFACSRALFGALEKVYAEQGDVSLSEGIQILARERRVGSCDLSGLFWQDVDTPEALRHAEGILFKHLGKPTDGWVSRYIDRPISIFLTRGLVRTPVTPNQVTLFTTLVGILSGYFVASGQYRDVALGGILFQLASILDGCDGEISRLKLSATKLGEWLDTASDNFTYLVFLVGVSIGTHRQLHGRFEVLEAVLMLVGVGILFTVLFFYLLHYNQSGSLAALQQDLQEEDKRQNREGFFSWTSKIHFMMRRDFFALLFMVLCLANQLSFVLDLSFVGVHMGWIVILVYKKDLFRPRLSRVKAVAPR